MKLFVTLFPCLILPGLSLGQGLEKPNPHPRVIKRTAMIERGREIIMEEVVFPTEQAPVTAGEVQPRPERSFQPAPSSEVALPQHSFVVAPKTFPSGLSLVTWWSTDSSGASQKQSCWSNLDWSVFGTSIKFETGQAIYTAMCLPGVSAQTLAEYEEEHAIAPPRWLHPLGASVGGRLRASHQRITPAERKRYQPDQPAHQFMTQLHRHFSQNAASLARDADLRKIEGEARRQERLREKQRPRDLRIRFGLRPRAQKATQEGSETPTQKADQ